MPRNADAKLHLLLSTSDTMHMKHLETQPHTHVTQNLFVLVTREPPPCGLKSLKANITEA